MFTIFVLIGGRIDKTEGVLVQSRGSCLWQVKVGPVKYYLEDDDDDCVNGRDNVIGAIGVAFVWIGVIREEMGDVEGENYDSLLRNLTNANTMLLNDASETLEFNSIDALDQVCQ